MYKIEVRTKDGTCIADINGKVAMQLVHDILTNGYGAMTTRNVVNKGKMQVLSITTATTFNIQGGALKLYLFEGSYIKMID